MGCVIIMRCEECESNNVDLMKEFESFDGHWVEEYWCKDCGNEFQDVSSNDDLDTI